MTSDREMVIHPLTRVDLSESWTLHIFEASSHAYIKNNNGESDNPYTYFDNFHWESAEEGYDYWSYWDDVWLEIITNEY